RPDACARWASAARGSAASTPATTATTARPRSASRGRATFTTVPVRARDPPTAAGSSPCVPTSHSSDRSAFEPRRASDPWGVPGAVRALGSAGARAAAVAVVVLRWTLAVVLACVGAATRVEADGGAGRARGHACGDDVPEPTPAGPLLEEGFEGAAVGALGVESAVDRLRCARETFGGE